MPNPNDKEVAAIIWYLMPGFERPHVIFWDYGRYLVAGIREEGSEVPRTGYEIRLEKSGNPSREEIKTLADALIAEHTRARTLNSLRAFDAYNPIDSI